MWKPDLKNGAKNWLQDHHPRLSAICCKRSAFNNLPNATSLIYCRHLALVNGICTAGQYSGTIVFSQVIQLVVEKKGLSGTFRILAGIASVMVFIALVYRQPPDTPGGTSPEKLCVKPKDTFDFSLLKDKSFFIFLLGTSLYAFGCYVPATHAVSQSVFFFFANALLNAWRRSVFVTSNRES